MTKVTSIQPQVKRAGRYNVFLDGKFAFSLSTDALLTSKLTVGQELTPTDIRKLKQLSADDKAYGLALAYVARRMRSEWELQEYGRRKGYSSKLMWDIIARLRDMELVDDREFARRWVENRRLLKAVSVKKLQLELRQKRVADEIIKEALAEDETDERQVLRELAAKKRAQSRYRQDPQKLMAYLARQGFSYDDIKSELQSND